MRLSESLFSTATYRLSPFIVEEPLLSFREPSGSLPIEIISRLYFMRGR
jgi:hypothetical protein